MRNYRRVSWIDESFVLFLYTMVLMVSIVAYRTWVVG